MPRLEDLNPQPREVFVSPTQGIAVTWEDHTYELPRLSVSVFPVHGRGFYRQTIEGTPGDDWQRVYPATPELGEPVADWRTLETGTKVVVERKDGKRIRGYISVNNLWWPDKSFAAGDGCMSNVDDRNEVFAIYIDPTPDFPDAVREKGLRERLDEINRVMSAALSDVIARVKQIPEIAALLESEARDE